MTFRLSAGIAFFLCSVVLLLVPAPVRAGDDWLPISPDDLKMTSAPQAPGAPAIYLYREVDRDDQTNFEKDYVRIKILTEEGRKQADIEITYLRDFGSVTAIKARTIEPDGTIINFDGKVYDKTVIKARGIKYLAKTFTLPNVQVGSIIEYRYTIQENPFYVFFSHWVLNTDLYTRQAKFFVRLDPYLTSRWVGQRLPAGVSLPKTAPNGTITLDLHDLPAFHSEDYMPPEEEFKSRVDFSYTLEYEPDSAKFWKSYGKDVNKKVEDFVKKRKAIEQFVADTVSASDSPEVKLQKLYAKVQSIHNTDLDPQKTEQEIKREKRKEATNAEEIVKHGYGTGGEITWLFLAAARAAGLDAEAVLVSTRDLYFFDPSTENSHQLNENIVLVHLNGKDLYFDPGIAFNPFGLLPWRETEVKGLRLDKDGGAWIITPRIPSSDSRVVRVARLKLTDEGSLEGSLSVTYTGLEALRRRHDEEMEDSTARKAYLEKLVQQYIPVGSEAELTNSPDWTASSPDFKAEFKIKIPGWASSAGRKALLPLGVFSAQEKHLFEHADRKYPVYFTFPWQDVDDITIDLPLGWRVNTLPGPVSVDRKFCSFEESAKDSSGTIHISRTLAVNGIQLEEKYYPVLRAFFQNLRENDEQQIIVSPAANAGQN